MHLVVTKAFMFTFITTCLLLEFCLSETLIRNKKEDKKYKIYEYEAPLGMTPEDLLLCFRTKYNIDPYIDSDLSKFRFINYVPEDLGEWFLHRQIEDSAYTTIEEEAEFFIVNTMPILSLNVGACNGMDHNERQSKWYNIIRNSESFQKRPQDHAFICQSYICRQAVSSQVFDLVRQMTYLIHEANLYWVSGYRDFLDPPLSKFPDHAIMIPYLTHSDITSTGNKSWKERSFNVVFLGSLKRLSPLRKVLENPEIQNLSTLYIQNEGLKYHAKDRASFDNYAEIMKDAQFCLVLQGDTVSTRRLFDAMIAGCIPVFAGPKYLMPFENLIPYDSFSIRFDTNIWFENAEDCITSLNVISESKALQMQNEMLKYVKYVDWRHGNYVLDAILTNMNMKRMNLVEPIQWHSCKRSECHDYSLNRTIPNRFTS